MHVWAHVCVSSAYQPLSKGPIPCPEAGGGALKKVKEEGREEEGRGGRRGEGGFPGSGLPPSVLSPPPSCPKDGEQLWKSA